MYREQTVGVVVPAYEEEGLVGEVIATMPPLVDRVYVVDDASPDGTWNEILEHADHLAADDESPHVVPIRHEENRGVGGAIKTGYKRALADEMDVVVVMGGDAQMDPGYLPALLGPIVDGHADYAKADRLASPEDRSSMPRLRLFGNYLLSGITRIASGYWQVSDPQNGYTAISQEALETVDVDEMYEYYGYCNDLLVKLNVGDMRVADVRVPAVYGEEESSIAYPEYVVRVSSMLFRNFLWRLHRKYATDRVHPLVVCYVLGGLAMVLAAVLASTDDEGPSPALSSGVGVTLVVAAAELDRRANRDLGVVVDA